MSRRAERMASRTAQRLMDLAEARGPQGVSAADFRLPTIDDGPPIHNVGAVIAQFGLPLVSTVVGAGEQSYERWMSPEHLDDEVLRTGWACVACHTRHVDAWPHDYCGACSEGPLMRARILHPAGHEALTP